MGNVSLLTPVTYGTAQKTWRESARELVDGYFYLGGKQAQVLQGTTKDGGKIALVVDGETTMMRTALKVLSYATIVLPLIMLVAKVVLWSTMRIQQITAREDLEKHAVEATKKEIDRLIKSLPKDRKFDTRMWGHDHIVIFGEEEVVRKCYADKVKAREACLLQGLDLLKFPQAKLFEHEHEGEKFVFIVERNVPVDTYSAAVALSDKAKAQLKTFIDATGFKKAELDTNPIDKSVRGASGKEPVRLLNLRVEYV